MPPYRCFSSADIDAISANEQRSSKHSWSREQFLSSLQSGHLGVGIYRDRQWVCHAVFSGVLDELELLLLSTLPEQRQQGLALALLRTSLAVFQRLRFARCLLEVRASNSAAIHLYRRLGFVEQGLRRAYYPAQGGAEGGTAAEDALLMGLALADADCLSATVLSADRSGED